MVAEQRSSDQAEIFVRIVDFAAIWRNRNSDMVEVLRTNDVVLLSFITACLDDANIDALVFDVHTSIMEGSLGVLPQRIMVADKDEFFARKLIEEAVGEQN